MLLTRNFQKILIVTKMNNQVINNNKTKNDYFLRLKNHYKKFLFVFLILILGISGVFYAKNVSEKKYIELSEKFNRAKILINNNEKNKSKEILLEIVNQKNKFYSPLSLYLIIEEELIKDSDSLKKLYDELLKIKDLEKDNKNLISYKKALFIIDKADEQEILSVLNPIINSDSIWRNNSINLIAEYFLFKNQKSKSEEYFKLLNK